MDMKFQAQEPPRVFRVGIKQDIEMHDCGRMYLHPDEQITFVTPSGKEHDFAAKSWGFYATPSINSRLKDQGFKTALVRNRSGRLYVMVVEKEKL
ncbi:MAG TPA: hypothetical protein EYP19_02520, partial [Desulfobacterales bacterium]|nr:hypothetical protein [Desulfobacterales bacterium]